MRWPLLKHVHVRDFDLKIKKTNKGVNQMNSKIGILGVLMLVLIGLLAVAVSATITGQVEVDGTTLLPDATTRLDLERGQTVDVRIELTSDADVENVEVTGFISGYEYNDYEPMSDTTHLFDMEAGVTYVKHLQLTLPVRVEEDNYKLRIMISDRYSSLIVNNYNLKLDVARHALQIRDVVFNPEGDVVAGRALLSTVRVQNIGDLEEQSVKVKVSIPSLGISASDYIDTVEAGDSTTSEELYLRIPADAKAGDYIVDVTVEYDEGFESLSGKKTIHVSEPVCTEDACKPAPEQGEEKTIITISTDMQQLVKGQGGSVYPIALTNEGKSTKTYVIKVDGTEGWATSRLSPSNVVVLAPGETSTVFIYLSATDAATAGEHMFSVSISSADTVLKQLPLKASVVGAQAPAFGWDKIKTALEIGFVILVVILVVLGLIIGFSKLREKDQPEEVSGQTYY
jgi:uncharacterized membrane protein